MPPSPSKRQYLMKPRQREVAFLAALLLSPAQIAERTGYSIYSVRDILRRDDVVELITQLQHERNAQAADALRQRILDDGPRNVDRIFELRDQDDNLSVAKGAAELLLDHQLPRVTRHEEERHVHVHISAQEVGEGRRVLAEAATIPTDDFTVEG